MKKIINGFLGAEGPEDVTTIQQLSDIHSCSLDPSYPAQPDESRWLIGHRTSEQTQVAFEYHNDGSQWVSASQGPNSLAFALRSPDKLRASVVLQQSFFATKKAALTLGTAFDTLEPQRICIRAGAVSVVTELSPSLSHSVVFQGPTLKSRFHTIFGFQACQQRLHDLRFLCDDGATSFGLAYCAPCDIRGGVSHKVSHVLDVSLVVHAVSGIRSLSLALAAQMPLSSLLPSADGNLTAYVKMGRGVDGETGLAVDVVGRGRISVKAGSAHHWYPQVGACVVL